MLPTPIPGSYKRKDYPFQALSEKDYEMEKLMASMKSMGMGGSMYNRDNMEEMMDQYKDQMGGDEDGYGDMMGGMGGMGGMESMMGGGGGGAGGGQDGYDDEEEDSGSSSRGKSKLEF
jgi:hypothetical protein